MSLTGNISRLTIPKSQGKQPYYDARKASWGDLFPHEPKNGLEIRWRGRSGQSTPAGAESAQDNERDEDEEKDEDDEDDEEFMKNLERFKGTYTLMMPS